jgi:hypothetical protein
MFSLTQIATASQPVISLCPTHPPEKRYLLQKEHLFFGLFYTPPYGQASVEPAAARSGKATVIYWGNLPMPQTPLDAHFL